MVNYKVETRAIEKAVIKTCLAIWSVHHKRGHVFGCWLQLHPPQESK